MNKKDGIFDARGKWADLPPEVREFIENNINVHARKASHFKQMVAALKVVLKTGSQELFLEELKKINAQIATKGLHNDTDRTAT